MIKIANSVINKRSPVYFIAEAGVNHNKSLDNAFRMIDIAFEAGADAIKFQTYNTSKIAIKNIKKAQYQIETTSGLENQYEMLKRLEIDESFHIKINDYSNEKGIVFLSTPYDEQSLNLLLRLGVSAIKIASTDATNLLFLEKAAKTGLPVILSTGMCLMDEISLACNVLRDNGCKQLALLKCTSSYPTKIEEVNLRGIATLARIFKTTVGYSDHTSGIGAAPYAVACGAKIIEKHFTLGKTMKGPDHRASLSPQELTDLICEIRKVEKMLGHEEIRPTRREFLVKKALQKHIVANNNIEKGEMFSKQNIVAKRTGGKGIPASALYNILGKEASRDLLEDEVVCYKDVLI